MKFDSVVVGGNVDEGKKSLMLLADVRLSGGDGISTRNPGSVFKQNDITEVQMKNTLIPATT
jgi:hypothetical protein